MQLAGDESPSAHLAPPRYFKEHGLDAKLIQRPGKDRYVHFVERHWRGRRARLFDRFHSPPGVEVAITIDDKTYRY